MTRQGKVLAREVEAYLAFWTEVERQREEEVVTTVTTARFVVVNNTPGYLPEDDDPATFEDLSSAVEYLREEVVRYCEHLIEVEESFRVHWSDDRDYATVENLDRIHDLGRVFEIIGMEEGDA